MDQNYSESSEQAAGIPIVFSPGPNASRSAETIAEALAASILRDEFLQKIHR